VLNQASSASSPLIMCCCLLTSRIKHGNELAATHLWIEELSLLLRGLTTARAAALCVLRALIAAADSWQGCCPGWIRRLCGCLLVSEYGLTSLTLLDCCKDVASAEAVAWLLKHLSCLVVCNCGLWSMTVCLAQAVADCWAPAVELRRDSLRVVIRVMTDDLNASPDAASLAVAELLPLLHVQLRNLDEGGGQHGADQQLPSSAAIAVLSHPMIFKSVISPVQRLASYSESVALGAVCPHALPCVSGILSAAQPWIQVHSSVSLASKLSQACEMITAASGTNSSALLTSAAILCSFLDRHNDATALFHMAVLAAEQAEEEAKATAAITSQSSPDESSSAAATLLNAFDSNFSSAGIVSSSWLMRLLGCSYLRQGRTTCAYHTLYAVTTNCVQWCLSRGRTETCTPNPMMPGMSKTSMVAAEGGLQRRCAARCKCCQML
jgi:hypothetical protein